MLKIVEFTAGDMSLHLCMNGAALFDFYDKFGRKGHLLDRIQSNDKAGFDNMCYMLAKLAEQGELVRRWQGFRPERIPTEARLRALLSPPDALRAKEAVSEAVALGFQMETERTEPEIIDVGLRKLREKNGTDLTMAEYLAPLTRLLGLTVREAMLLTPGQTADLMETVRRKE